MNKQDLLKTLEEWKEFRKIKNHELQYYQLAEVIHLVKQLDNHEKVKVPLFVVPFIEKLKNTNRRYGVELEKAYKSEEDEDLANWLWYNENVLTLFKALENDYEFEDDQKYSVVIANKYLIKMFSDKNKHMFVSKDALSCWHYSAYELTEKEIKSIDRRYWPFAVAVKKV